MDKNDLSTKNDLNNDVSFWINLDYDNLLAELKNKLHQQEEMDRLDKELGDLNGEITRAKSRDSSTVGTIKSLKNDQDSYLLRKKKEYRQKEVSKLKDELPKDSAELPKINQQIEDLQLDKESMQRARDTAKLNRDVALKNEDQNIEFITPLDGWVYKLRNNNYLESLSLKYKPKKQEILYTAIISFLIALIIAVPTKMYSNFVFTQSHATKIVPLLLFEFEVYKSSLIGVTIFYWIFTFALVYFIRVYKHASVAHFFKVLGLRIVSYPLMLVNLIIRLATAPKRSKQETKNKVDSHKVAEENNAKYKQLGRKIVEISEQIETAKLKRKKCIQEHEDYIEEQVAKQIPPEEEYPLPADVEESYLKKIKNEEDKHQDLSKEITQLQQRYENKGAELKKLKDDFENIHPLPKEFRKVTPVLIKIIQLGFAYNWTGAVNYCQQQLQRTQELEHQLETENKLFSNLGSLEDNVNNRLASLNQNIQASHAEIKSEIESNTKELKNNNKELKRGNEELKRGNEELASRLADLDVSIKNNGQAMSDMNQDVHKIKKHIDPNDPY